MEKKELPEEIQIKKVQKADSEIKYISFGTYNIYSAPVTSGVKKK